MSDILILDWKYRHTKFRCSLCKSINNVTSGVNEDLALIVTCGDCGHSRHIVWKVLSVKPKPIRLPLVLKVFPELTPDMICGVQPMTDPTDLVHALKSRYAE